MKKKIVNGFLMMALLVSAMGTFVSCKDYDEDSYVDLRNRISNEVSLREALQQQVNGLAADIEQIKSLYATMAWVNENFYTKEQIDSKFVTIEEFAKCKADCAAFKKLLNERIDSLNNVVNGIKAEMATKDDIANVIALINKTNEAVEAVKAIAEEALTIAKDNKAAIEALAERVGKNESDISKLNELINTLKEKVDGYDAVIQTLTDKVNDLSALILGWDAKITEMNDRIAAIEVKLDAYNTRIESLENSYNELYALYLSQQGDINDIKLQIQELNEKVANINNEWALEIQATLNLAIETSNEAKELAEKAMLKAGDAMALAEAAMAKASNAEQLALNALYAANEAVRIATETAERLDAAIKRAEDAAAAAEAWAKKAEASAADAADKAKAAEDAKKAAEEAQKRCEEIYELIKDYKPGEIPADLEERLAKAEKDAADAKAAAEEAKSIAETAKSTAETAKSIAEGIKAVADEAKELAEKAKEAADKAAEDAKAAKEKADKLETDLSELEKKVNANTIKIGDLEKALENESKKLNDAIEAVDSKVSTLSTTVENLGKDLDALKADFKSLITGITIQATSNPVLGYLNLPLDTRSMLLMSYFGKPDGRFQFPAQGGKWVNGIDGTDAFTARDIAIMTGGSDLSSVEGYASYTDEFIAKDNGSGQVAMGKVYVTVNPTNVDFTGKTLTLENSQGKKSKVELSPLRKSDYLITNGYDRTRAASNGFYEATALLNIDDVASIRLSLDTASVISQLKTIWKNKKNLGSYKSEIFSVLEEIYKSLDNQVEANALKATWTDKTVGERSIISTYAIGAATVKPLSFNTLKNGKFEKWPGENVIERIISKIINQIEIKCPVNVGKDFIKFNSVEAVGGKLTISFDAYVNGTPQTMTIEVEVGEDAKTVQDLGTLLIETTNGSSMSVELGELLTELYNLNENWDNSIEDAKQNMIDGMMKYVLKAYDKANSFYHLSNAFDIKLVIHKDGKGFRFPSMVLDRPTEVSGEVALYPTSNSLEYFAPAFKKLVAISNVYDSSKNPLPEATAISMAKAASGENMGIVIDGDTRVVIKGQAGYIYEVTYLAVDYHGYKNYRKYYLKF